MCLDEMDKYNPYELDRSKKQRLFLERMNDLTYFHYHNCTAYKKVCEHLYEGKNKVSCLEKIPFLPVALFKTIDLSSVAKDKIFKVLTSSGTTGQQVSKIYLDRETSANQQRVLVKIVSDFIGKSRMPMIILDCPGVIRNRKMFSARGAGILGFSIFARDKIFAFDDDMNLDLNGIRTFLKKHEGETIFLFGFTYMIWQYFFKNLEKMGTYLPLEDAVMVHGGGWKKLIQEAVSKEKFKSGLNKVCGISRIHDYYGMVEQTGCIYMECEEGHLHASVFSDVLIRNMNDFSLCKNGEIGAIQVLSVIPESYPGHSILTEDVGRILGEDDCACGRQGKYFEVLGRMKQAEVRGCSDTFENVM